MQNYRKNKYLEKKNMPDINPRRLFITILIACSALTGCFLSESAPIYYHYAGSSMEPTISDSNYLTIDPTAYDENLPERHDIIVFTHPKVPENHLLKRIIGLPGEKITIQDGNLWIDDQLIDETYIREPARYNGEWLLGEQEYIVLGDNRNNSSDSHNWGALPFENIEGKAIHICINRDILSCQEIETE